MSSNLLLKIIGLFLLIELTFAKQTKNECKEIESYIRECLNKKNTDIEISYYLTECSVNNDGKVISIGIHRYEDDFEDEEIKNILSHETLTKVKYEKICEDDICPDDTLKTILKLPKLEELNYIHDAEYASLTSSVRGYLTPESLKFSKSLKKLNLYGFELSKENGYDISELSNLEVFKCEKCHLDKACINKNMPKLKTSDLKICSEKTTTNTKKTTTKKSSTTKKTTTKSKTSSTNGKCGNGVSCPSGQCCSKYGWCGTSEKHCGNGCQSEFGKCNHNNKTNTTSKKTTATTTKKTTTTTKKATTTSKKTTTTKNKIISTNSKCGDGVSCPSDQCCSKYGWCGTSEKHCGSGCQSEFGKCNINSKITTTTTKKTATTKKTTTTKKTSTTKSKIISTNSKCGDGVSCPSSQCCSKYGWCGTSEKHCGNGCQFKYGKCN